MIDKDLSFDNHNFNNFMKSNDIPIRNIGTSQENRRNATGMSSMQNNNKPRSHVASRRMSPSAPRSEGFVMGIKGE